MEPGGQRRGVRVPRPGEASVSKGATSNAVRFARAPARVRIIGGQWKRTPLPVADEPGLRPSPDRVRVTVFNWLAHFFPGLGTCGGLDLFAGTGALGFELASRGAGRVVLVERNPALVAGLQRTKQKLNAEAISIIAGDALAYARSAPDRSFDIVFLDPPFDGDLLRPALDAASRLVTPEGVVYAECGAPLEPTVAANSGLRIVRDGRAGQVHFHLLQRA